VPEDRPCSLSTEPPWLQVALAGTMQLLMCVLCKHGAHATLHHAKAMCREGPGNPLLHGTLSTAKRHRIPCAHVCAKAKHEA
jgi:hypothetical protein